MTPAELQERASKARSEIGGQVAVSARGLSVNDAIARALEFNLDHRLEIKRALLTKRRLELTRFDLLPELVAELAWNGRDSLAAGSSRSFATGTESLEPSYSVAKSNWTTNLKLSWSVIDFGVSFMRAQQAADRVLLAEEQRRRVLQRIVHDVRVAYWRAVTAELALENAEILDTRVAKAIATSRQTRARKLSSPLTSLTFERELIGIQRELRELQRDLGMAQIQLAALLNLPPGEPPALATGEIAIKRLGLEMGVDEMVDQALLGRPELREVAYEERINKAEAKLAMIELLPGAEFNVGVYYDDNELLVNRDWFSWGARLTQSLTRLVGLPARLGRIQAEEELLAAQQEALSLAVVTQVYVARALYEHTSREFESTVAFEDAQTRIVEHVRKSASASRTTEQNVIREEMNALIATVKRGMAYAELEGAFAQVQIAMGVDPFPTSVGAYEKTGKSSVNDAESLAAR